MRARALLPLLPLLVPAAAHAAPSLPRTPCVRASTHLPDAAHLSGDAYVRVAPDGTATWLLRDVRYAAFSGAHAAWWVEPAHAAYPSVLCVDGVEVHRGHFAGGLAWSPGGRRLAYTENELDGTTQVRILGGASMPGWAFAWSPAGDRLAVAGAGTIEVHRLDGALTTTLDTDRYAYVVDWAGDRVLYGASSGDGVTSEVVTVRPDGTGRTVLSTDPVARYAVAPDGSRVAYWDRNGLATSALDGTDPVALGVRAPLLAFSPDSATLAYAGSGIGATVAANGTTSTTVVTGDVTALGWVARDTPWFTTRAADDSRDVVVAGRTVAHAEPGHMLRIVRRDADGSYVVAVERLRSNPLPTTG